MVQRSDELPEGCAGDTRPLGVLTHAKEQRVAGAQVVDPVEQNVDDSLVIEVPTSASAPLMLPFVAWAEVGQSLKSATRQEAPILTSGNVTFLRSSLLSFGRGLPHTAGATQLSPGDRFFVPAQREPGFGFARVDEQSGLLVGYRATGRQAEIERFGMRSYAIRPTMAEAFAGDSSVQLFMALVGAVAALAQTLSVIRISRPTEGGLAAPCSSRASPEERRARRGLNRRQLAPPPSGRRCTDSANANVSTRPS